MEHLAVRDLARVGAGIGGIVACSATAKAACRQTARVRPAAWRAPGQVGQAAHARPARHFDPVEPLA